VLPKSRQLFLWVGTDADVSFGDMAVVAGQPAAVQGGKRYKVTVKAGANRLTFVAPGRGLQARWQLRLAEPEHVPFMGSVLAARRAGKFPEAAARAKKGLSARSPVHRGLALGQLGRIALSEKRDGAAERHLRSAIRSHRKNGRIFDEIVDATVLVYALMYRQRRFADARTLLDMLTDETRGFAPAAIFLDYFRGLLAFSTGDLRNARRQVQSAARRAERLQVERLGRFARQVLANLLDRVGRRQEASAVYDALARSQAGASPCDRAKLFNDRGWSGVLALEAGHSPAHDPAPLLRKALRLYESECRQLPEDRVGTLINLALAQILSGDASAAQGTLEKLKVPPPGAAAPAATKQKQGGNDRARISVRHALWSRSIVAQVDLMQGRPRRALRRYDKLARMAEAVASSEVRRRATVGRARSLAALGRVAAALAAYEQAELQLRDAALRVALGDGRSTFTDTGRQATREYVRLLLSKDMAARAMDVVRRARARALRSFGMVDHLARLEGAQRRGWETTVTAYWRERDELDRAAANAWQIPSDQIAAALDRQEQRRQRLRRLLDRARALLTPDTAEENPPLDLDPDEVALLFYPLGEQWIGFAADRQGVRGVGVGQLESGSLPAELGRRLLRPFAAQIARNQQIRFLPFGHLRDVDLHALPWREDVLLTYKRVVYSLDLPGPRADRRRIREVLVVADPEENLPHALREVAAIDRLGATAGWARTLLRGPAARPADLMRLLPGADLFHFAGHARFRAEDGGWNSALRLADGSVLRLGDVLTLVRAPGLVVLLGCETGRTPKAGAAGLGLAQAFVMAGSRGVIASVRPIDDGLAASFTRELYAGEDVGLGSPAAWRRTQLQVRARDPGADWASVRMMVP
jgi:tetratricopeptide (TPR) repeat protein